MINGAQHELQTQQIAVDEESEPLLNSTKPKGCSNGCNEDIEISWVASARFLSAPVKRFPFLLYPWLCVGVFMLSGPC